jgi:hypothetical protein
VFSTLKNAKSADKTVSVFSKKNCLCCIRAFRLHRALLLKKVLDQEAIPRGRFQLNNPISEPEKQVKSLNSNQCN